MGQHLLDGTGQSGTTSSPHWPPTLGVTPSGSFLANTGLSTEVLVAAARQHLMAVDVQELRLPQVALLLSDYQQLAASYHASVMLSR